MDFYTYHQIQWKSLCSIQGAEPEIMGPLTKLFAGGGVKVLGPLNLQDFLRPSDTLEVYMYVNPSFIPAANVLDLTRHWLPLKMESEMDKNWISRMLFATLLEGLRADVDRPAPAHLRGVNRRKAVLSAHPKMGFVEWLVVPGEWGLNGLLKTAEVRDLH